MITIPKHQPSGEQGMNRLTAEEIPPDPDTPIGGLLSGWWLVVYWIIIAVLAGTLIFMLGLIAYGIVTG